MLEETAAASARQRGPAMRFELLGLAVFALIGGQMLIRLRTLAARNAELEAAFGKLQSEAQHSAGAVQLSGGAPSPCPAAVPAPCPDPAPPPPPPPPPPPCPVTDAPAAADTVGAAPAPAPTASGGGGDWRLPKGPAPSRPSTMPGWFKWQPKSEEWCLPGPHSRHHSKRIAAIVVNYNMVERANSIAEGIKKHVKWPVDIIVVDNGSDLKDSPPSPYTAIRLEANVQTANGWMMGIEYAKALGHVSRPHSISNRWCHATAC